MYTILQTPYADYVPYVRHLIADHLGWFKESMEDGKLKTIEDLMHAKGEVIRRGRLDAGEVIEYSPD